MHIGTGDKVENDNHDNKEGHDCEVEGRNAVHGSIEHVHKPVHVWEDAEGVNDSERHEEQEEAVELLDELCVPPKLVNVCNCRAEVFQVKLVLKLVTDNDWGDCEGNLEEVPDHSS